MKTAVCYMRCSGKEQTFGDTWDAVRRISQDLNNCPTTQAEVEVARGSHWWGGNPHAPEPPGHFPEDEEA